MTARIGHEDVRLQRMEQATLWLQRMRDADADGRVVDDWLEWCQRDPLNQQAFDEMAEIWELTGRIGDASTDARAIAPAPVQASRRALFASLSGVGLLAIGGAWWLARPAPQVVATVEYRSPVGMNATHTLPDGSVLELGGGTEVAVVMAAHERRVVLRSGELFVTVSHDSSRPFKVESDMIEVVATGTAFNVQRTAARTTVAVAEGSVDALYRGQSGPDSKLPLQAGQQLVHPHGTSTLEVRQVDLRHVGAWRTGMLYFAGVPLSDVVDTLNRYAGARILVEDARLSAEPYGGSARIDNIDGWLKALPLSFAATVATRADGTRVILPRKSARPE
jgi:transmembrane sensor